jgi:hypothetical protein
MGSSFAIRIEEERAREPILFGSIIARDDGVAK